MFNVRAVVVEHRLADVHTRTLRIWGDGNTHHVDCHRVDAGASGDVSFDVVASRWIAVSAHRDCVARDDAGNECVYFAPNGDGDWEFGATTPAVGATQRVVLRDVCVPNDTDAPLPRGYVVLRITAVSPHAGAAKSAPPSLPLTELDARMARRERAYLDALTPPLGAAGLSATNERCSGAHVPTFMTRIGVRVPSCYLLAWMPAAGYERHAAWQQLCQRALECALHLNAASAAEFVHAAAADSAADAAGAAKIVADACTLYATAGVVYADDSVYYGDDADSAAPTERFINVLDELGGDCEDVGGRCCTLFARVMQRGQWPSASPELRAARRVLQHYVIGAATSLATDRAAPGRGSGGGGGGGEQQATHVWGVLLERTAWQQALSANAGGGGGSSVWPRVVVLEGTSYQTPLPLALCSYLGTGAAADERQCRAVAAAARRLETVRRRAEQRCRALQEVPIQVKAQHYDTAAERALDDATPAATLSPFYRHVTTTWAYTSDTDDTAVETYVVYDAQSRAYGVRYCEYAHVACPPRGSMRAKPVLPPLSAEERSTVVHAVLPRLCPITSPLEARPLDAHDAEHWRATLLPERCRRRLEALASPPPPPSRPPLPLLARDLAFISYRFRAAPSDRHLHAFETLLGHADADDDADPELHSLQYSLLIMSHEVAVLEVRLFLKP
jgi:hypothetical protein